jgi:hypothetical protein
MMESACERVCEREHHRDTNTDQERRIDQTSKQEHFGLQAVHQFWLASRGFDEFAAHDANADTCANSAEADDQTTSECYEGDVSHENSLNSQSQKNKTRILQNWSVTLMCLTEINQGQHHEDECLQQHDQNVEDRPN